MKIRLLGAAVAAVFTLIGSAAHADDLADIRKKGEIVIGTLGTDEPNSFIDPKTRQIIGYEVDLGTEIAKAIGVKPVFKQISVAARIPELQQGHVDLLAASLTHNKEREALVDFSYSIIVTGQKALVKKNAGFASLHDLDGKKVLTVKGGTQEPNIRKALPNAQVVTFETSQQALLALQQGQGSGLRRRRVGTGQRFRQARRGGRRLRHPAGEPEYRGPGHRLPQGQSATQATGRLDPRRPGAQRRGGAAVPQVVRAGHQVQPQRAPLQDRFRPDPRVSA